MTSAFHACARGTGQAHYVLSPHHRATLEADKRAFVAMMSHLRRSIAITA